MDISDLQELGKAIRDIEGILGITIDPHLEQQYLAGNAWGLPAYEKIHTPAPAVKAIQKYLICAKSHLSYQESVPKGDLSNFYDIQRAARIVPLVRVLANSLRTVTRKTQNYEARLGRLREEFEIDPFEAILYELAVAAKYAEHPDAESVKFIDEAKGKGQSPDLSAKINRREWTIECKKFDRTSDYSAKLRDQMRDLSQPVLAAIRAEQRSAVVELTLRASPDLVSSSEIASAAVDSLRSGGAILSDKYTVVSRPTPPIDSSNYTLYPSPAYFWQRFQHLDGVEFQGIVCALIAKFAGPSWLDEIGWDAAVKWKVLDSQSNWKRQKLGYARIYKGLDQLHNASHPILHVCYERDLALGPRRDDLLRFLEELATKQKNIEWLIFNELAPTVSIGGRFDFTEHSHFHFASSTKKADSPPPVLNVFSDDEDLKSADGEFGVGAHLPSIDEE